MAKPSPDLNVRLERRDIRGADTSAPTYRVRAILNDRDVVLTSEQAAAALALLDMLDPSKPAAKTPPSGG